MTTQQDLNRVESQYEPTEAEWQELINREVADLPEVSEIPEVTPPGSPKQGTITHVGTNESPGDTRIAALAFEGFVEVWNRKTGDKSLQPRWLLWQTMSKTFEDGTKVYTMTDPKIPQSLGDDLPCFLHPSHEMSDRLRKMGFPECRKAHLRNQQARNAHCRHSHKAAWSFLEDDKAERIREEDRQIQRDLLRVMSEAAMRGINVEVPESVKQFVADDIPIPTRKDLFTANCPRCLKDFTGKSRKRANAKVLQHDRFCKE